MVTAQVGAAPVPTSPIGWTGSLEVGNVLDVTTGSWSVISPNLSYQWYRNGTKIGGAVGQQYTSVPADLGKTLTVRVFAQQNGYRTGSPLATVGVVTSPDFVVNLTKPKITGLTDSGQGRVDLALTASPGTWTPSGYSVSYQWLRNGLPIPSATASTYTPIPADIGLDISVAVTAKKPFFHSGTERSGSYIVNWGSAPSILTPADFSATGISGAGTTASPFKVASLVWSIAATVQYQWRYQAAGGGGWTDIVGANSTSYTPTGFVPSGASVQVLVSAVRDGHLPFQATSNAIVVP